eukprot:5701184-Amphidinium_carterae.1
MDSRVFALQGFSLLDFGSDVGWHGKALCTGGGKRGSSSAQARSAWRKTTARGGSSSACTREVSSSNG